MQPGNGRQLKERQRKVPFPPLPHTSSGRAKIAFRPLLTRLTIRHLSRRKGEFLKVKQRLLTLLTRYLPLPDENANEMALLPWKPADQPSQAKVLSLPPQSLRPASEDRGGGGSTGTDSVFYRSFPGLPVGPDYIFTAVFFLSAPPARTVPGNPSLIIVYPPLLPFHVS